MSPLPVSPWRDGQLWTASDVETSELRVYAAAYSDSLLALETTRADLEAQIAAGGGGGGTIELPTAVVYGGTSNDTAEVLAALAQAAASATGHGTVFIADGTTTTDPFTIPANVTIDGVRWRSILKRRGGTTGAFISNATGATQITVRNVVVDGNGTGPVGLDGALAGDSSCHGLAFTYAGEAPANTYDQRLLLENVYVTRNTGRGVYISGRPENWLRGVLSYKNGGENFRLGDECYANDIVSGRAGDDGIVVVGVGCILTNGKAWWSGRNHTTYGGSGSGGNGLILQHNYPTSNARGTLVSDFNAQDNLLQGFSVVSSIQAHLKNCHADNNNLKATDAGVYTAFATTGVGFDVWASPYCTIRGSASNRPAAGGAQPATQTDALRIRSTSTNCDIHIMQEGMTRGALAPSSDARVGNKLRFNLSDGGFQAPAFATSFTPDPFAGSIIKPSIMTGNMTVTAPASRYSGMVYTLILQQGTGGNTVTFDGNHKARTAINTAAGALTSWTFVDDGAFFVEV